MKSSLTPAVILAALLLLAFAALSAHAAPTISATATAMLGCSGWPRYPIRSPVESSGVTNASRPMRRG